MKPHKKSLNFKKYAIMITDIFRKGSIMGYKMEAGKVVRTSFPKTLSKSQVKQIDSAKVNTDIIENAQDLMKKTNLVRSVATHI